MKSMTLTTTREPIPASILALASDINSRIGDQDIYVSEISKMGDRYGSLLIKLMDRYGAHNLQEITAEQAEAFCRELKGETINET